MSIVNQPLAFVDVETNGGMGKQGRVIEVGIVRVEHSREVGRLSTLIDPGDRVPPWITRLTGITSEELESAPTFRQQADNISALLDGAIVIAHNVTFDYSMLKAEFLRLGETFAPSSLCTARLSRTLFPGFRKHSLDALIERHQLPVANRHRALDDAVLIWQFYQLCLQTFDLDMINSAVDMQLLRQASRT
jgi:DNA polymerase-3 subunit epsilon